MVTRRVQLTPPAKSEIFAFFAFFVISLGFREVFSPEDAEGIEDSTFQGWADDLTCH
jgi:hypothetical protein